MLTTDQAKTLEAAVNVIIPSDGGPSGWESGVGDYLFRQFERDLQSVVKVYQQGLSAIDHEALAVTGVAFADLNSETQEMLFKLIEDGQVQTHWPVNPADFFKTLIEHCAEGYYSDPGNGGNRDGVAWKLIGFEVTG